MNAEDKERMHAVADAHAVADWKQGRRWSCMCTTCVQARSEWYEPRGNGYIRETGDAS